MASEPTAFGRGLVIFRCRGARLALPFEEVVEVHRAVAVNPLPGAPAVVRGVVDIHEEIVPVYDIGLRVDGCSRPVKPSDVLVVANRGDLKVALLVEELERWREDAPVSVASVEPHTGGIGGAVRTSDGLVLIHDLDTFLEESEERQLRNALESFERSESE